MKYLLVLFSLLSISAGAEVIYRDRSGLNTASDLHIKLSAGTITLGDIIHNSNVSAYARIDFRFSSTIAFSEGAGFALGFEDHVNLGITPAGSDLQANVGPFSGMAIQPGFAFINEEGKLVALLLEFGADGNAPKTKTGWDTGAKWLYVTKEQTGALTARWIFDREEPQSKGGLDIELHLQQNFKELKNQSVSVEARHVQMFNGTGDWNTHLAAEIETFFWGSPSTGGAALGLELGAILSNSQDAVGPYAGIYIKLAY